MKPKTIVTTLLLLLGPEPQPPGDVVPLFEPPGGGEPA